MTSSTHRVLGNAIVHQVCATTAQFPAVDVVQAVDWGVRGLSEGLWGTLSSAHMQLCPQSAGVITAALAEALRARYPATQLRLHANARVLPQHHCWDLSTVDHETMFYYRALIERSDQLGAGVISIHAGRREHCPSLDRLWDHWRQLQELADTMTAGRLTVAVEGLYPHAVRPQWLDSWASHEQLLKQDIPFALDLSHLNIIAHHDGAWDHDLVDALLQSPRCVEMHVSSNDGTSDRHAITQRQPPWWRHWESHLAHPNPNTVVFSEGCLAPPNKPLPFERTLSRQDILAV